MTPDELRAETDLGLVDTVVVAFTDHYGRNMGKRLDARFFVEEALADGTHACDYLLTVDMEMEPVEGYAFSSWSGGYGDMHLVPDPSTLRRAAWADRTALILCDVVDGETGEPVTVAPRSILKRQIDEAAAAGFRVEAASELEFFFSRDSYRQANLKHYRDLEPAGWYVEDYHLVQGARVEDYVGAVRRALREADIPVESSKGEAAIGQHEINIGYAPVLDMADRHVVMKQAMKEVADQQGVSVTFMAKPDATQPGNSCHLHLSLWHTDNSSSGNGRSGNGNAFVDEAGGPSDIFRWFLGGWMHHTPELMVCYAPTINAYKRYQDQSWAPTGIAWSNDNRTAGFRIVGRGQSRRIECRLPGADVNPYLAYAAAMASGLDGIANRIEPLEELHGDAYSSEIGSIPLTLAEASDRFATSSTARRLLGDEVVEHYSHFHTMECQAFNRAVTDWEQRRYYERI